MNRNNISRILWILVLFLVVGLATLTRAQMTKFDSRSLKRPDTPAIILAAQADLDQCRNGTELAPVGCDDSAEWVNGNANAQQAHWSETEYLAYRMKFTGLTPGPYTVVIGYDILKSGKHAIDYLGTYNATETTANPCAGLADCTGTPMTWPIPEDTLTVTSNINPNTGLPIVQHAGEFTMWGGTITDAQYLTYAGGEERLIKVTFNATITDPVLAWGGHIAWIGDWGAGNSAVAVSGSPYHMRLKGLCPDTPATCTTGGNQDRSLDNDAVVPSGVINIRKEVFTINSPNAAFTTFNFTASANFGTTAFGLIDDNDGPGVDTQQSAPITSFGPTVPVTVTEASTNGWTLLNVNCVEDVTQDSTKNSALPTATIIVQQGETITCTYQNSQLASTAAPATISGQIRSARGYVYNATVSVTNLTTGEVRYTRSNMFGYYQMTSLQTGQLYVVCVSAKGYTFTPDQIVVNLTEDFVHANFFAAR